jgi:phosphatidylglycerophosphatase A
VTARVALLLASAGYTGYFPVAPGTVGSLVGLVVWGAVRTAGGGVVAELALVAGLLVVGAWAATVAERTLGVTDPGPVVIDEVLGMCVTLFAAPATLATAIAGFFLFRFFDIVKPPPARQLERAHGGWGIMLDDLAAGIYAWAVLALTHAFAPEWLS